MAPTRFAIIPKYHFFLSSNYWCPPSPPTFFSFLFPFLPSLPHKALSSTRYFFSAFDISTESWNCCVICTMESEFFYFFCFQAINMIPLCYKFIRQWNLDFVMLQTLSHNGITISLYYKFCNEIILPLCYGSMKKCFRYTKWGRIFLKNENDCRGH